MKDAENILKNRTWLGTTSVTLSQHMGLHCKAFITLTECADHIPVEIPNGQARVTYLLDSIKTIDPSVLAAMAAVRQDDADKRVNFENAFTFLAPSCPVLAKAAKKGRVSFDVNVSGALEANPTRVASVGIVRSQEREQLGLLSVTTSLRSSRTYPRNSRRSSLSGIGPTVGRATTRRGANALQLLGVPAKTSPTTKLRSSRA